MGIGGYNECLLFSFPAEALDSSQRSFEEPVIFFLKKRKIEKRLRMFHATHKENQMVNPDVWWQGLSRKDLEHQVPAARAHKHLREKKIFHFIQYGGNDPVNTDRGRDSQMWPWVPETPCLTMQLFGFAELTGAGASGKGCHWPRQMAIHWPWG